MSNISYEHHPYNDPKLPFLCQRYSIKQMRISDLHWHEHLEFLHGLSGSGLVGAHRYPLNAGDTVIINTGDPHNVCSETEVEYDCLIVNADFCRENGFDVDLVSLVPHIHDSEASRLISKACDAFRENGPLRVLHTRAAVLNFLTYLCENHTTERRPFDSTPSLKAIKKSVRFIRSHHTEQITLDDAAAAAGLSRYYFAREFRNVTGQSFVPYLNSVRCEQALQLLKSGMSVTEVCYACGFRELAYFSRMFRKIVGQPPSAVKKVNTSEKTV